MFTLVFQSIVALSVFASGVCANAAKPVRRRGSAMRR
jgi:hypothetical protein